MSFTGIVYSRESVEYSSSNRFRRAGHSGRVWRQLKSPDWTSVLVDLPARTSGCLRYAGLCVVPKLNWVSITDATQAPPLTLTCQKSPTHLVRDDSKGEQQAAYTIWHPTLGLDAPGRWHQPGRSDPATHSLPPKSSVIERFSYPNS